MMIEMIEMIIKILLESEQQQRERKVCLYVVRMYTAPLAPTG